MAKTDTDPTIPFSDFIEKSESATAQRSALLRLTSAIFISPSCAHHEKKQYKGRKKISSIDNEEPKTVTTPPLDILRSQTFLPHTRASASRKTQRTAKVYTLHLLRLAVIDNRTEKALYLIHALKKNLLKQKYFATTNLVFILALVLQRHAVVTAFLAHNFPKNVNASAIPLANSISRNFSTFPPYFMLAIATGAVDTVCAMINKGANLKASWFGITPLIQSTYARRNKAASIQRMLHNAGLTTYDTIPVPLYLLLCKLKRAFAPRGPGAVEHKKCAVDKEFLATRRLTVFEFLAHAGDVQAVKRYVAQFRYDDAAVTLAASQYCLNAPCDAELVGMYLNAGMDVTQPVYPSRVTALHVAAARGCTEVVELLLQQEAADCNAQDATGKTALHYAAAALQAECIKTLVSHGADYSIADCTGCTPTHYALKNGMRSEDAVMLFEKKVQQQQQQQQQCDAGLQNDDVTSLTHRLDKCLAPPPSGNITSTNEKKGRFIVEKIAPGPVRAAPGRAGKQRAGNVIIKAEVEHSSRVMQFLRLATLAQRMGSVNNNREKKKSLSNELLHLLSPLSEGRASVDAVNERWRNMVVGSKERKEAAQQQHQHQQQGVSVTMPSMGSECMFEDSGGQGEEESAPSSFGPSAKMNSWQRRGVRKRYVMWNPGADSAVGCNSVRI